MPYATTAPAVVTPVRNNDAVRMTGYDPLDFASSATDGYRLGVKRIDPVDTAPGTPFTFAMPEVGAEWNIGSYDDLLAINGTSTPLVSFGGEPLLKVNDTSLPFEGEYFLVGVVEWAGSTPGNTIDWMILYREKNTVDVYDTATLAVDAALLDVALGLAGHNVKYRAVSLATGQPSQHEVALFNPGITDLSTDPDDLDSNVGMSQKLDFTTEIDNNGDNQQTICE